MKFSNLTPLYFKALNLFFLLSVLFSRGRINNFNLFTFAGENLYEAGRSSMRWISFRAHEESPSIVCESYFRAHEAAVLGRWASLKPSQVFVQ